MSSGSHVGSFLDSIDLPRLFFIASPVACNVFKNALCIDVFCTQI
jgi:hypothetical protein